MTRRSVPPPGRKLRAPALALLGLVAVGVTACASASAQEQAEDQEIGLLFAPTAGRGTMEPIAGTSRFELTLNDVNAQVVWFSDRPARQSGHIPIAEFVESWKGYGFVEDPPNAALSVLGADDSQDTVVVELGSPDFDEQDNTVRFSVEVLDDATGNLSHLASDVDPSVEASFGPASLFIDDATGTVINGCTIQPHTKCFFVNMNESKLHGADLSYANLRFSDLEGADLSNANLSSADLRSTALKGANLSNASMSDANAEGANLKGANMNGADLSRADFLWASVQGSTAHGAIVCYTKEPDGELMMRDCKS